MDEILKRLRDVCAQTCGESTDEWCETHRTCLECRMDLLDLLEKELDGWVELTKDANEVSVSPGDLIHLRHNGEDRRVVSVTLCEDGTWLVHCDKGGSFEMPKSKEYVTHAEPDTFERIIRDAMHAIPDEAALAELVARCERLAGGRA